MTDDWAVDGSPTDWRPQVDLPTGIAQLWEERTRERA
jgi:hypothetical protein